MKRFLAALALLSSMGFTHAAMAQASALGSVVHVIATQQAADNNVTVAGTLQIEAFDIAAACASGCLAEIFDVASVPSDGTYTGSAAPLFCHPLTPPVTPATWSGLGMINPLTVPRSALGLSVVVSSGADCYHLVKIAAYISMQYAQ